MKICWDTLNKLKYYPDKECWVDRTYVKFFYKEACIKCGDPYISARGESVYCTKKCAASGKHNHMWGKKHTTETRRKMSKARKGRVGKLAPSWKGGYFSKNLAFYDTYAQQINYVDKVRRDPDDTNVLQVRCNVCNKWYSPTPMDIHHRKYTLVGTRMGEFRFYCSDICKEACTVFGQISFPKGFRNGNRPLQTSWARMIKKRANYKCEICGKNDCTLIAHHIEGIEQNPLMSADLEMGIALCEECNNNAHSSSGCRRHELQRC